MKIRLLANNKKFFMPFVIICLSLLVILSSGTLIMNSIKAGAVKENSAALQHYNDENAKMAAENLKAFEFALKASFSKPQLIKIAQSGTKYGLSINGTNIANNNNTIYSDRPTVGILIFESYGRVALDTLPRSIIEMSSVIELNTALKLVKIEYGKATLKTKLYNYYYGKSLSYTVSNLKPGDIITIEILPDVARKIGLSDNIIEIFYNKAG